jgi:iron complex transport system ATP-binding protein
MTHTLEASSLSLGYGDHVIVEDLTLETPPKNITAIVGANGSGKSTILRGLARVLKARAGMVMLDGRDIRQHASRAVARIIALLPQAPHVPAGMTVRTLVSLGRFPHSSPWGGLSARDREVVQGAMQRMGIDEFADRPLHTLSGGQVQLVWLAMAMAQETDYLLLDEPTTYLDVAHQIELLERLARLNRDFGKTIIMVLHDLNMAARYAGHMIVVNGGRVLHQGPPWDIMQPHILSSAFGIEAAILRDPKHGSPICVPYCSESGNGSGSGGN